MLRVYRGGTATPDCPRKVWGPGVLCKGGVLRKESEEGRMDGVGSGRTVCARRPLQKAVSAQAKAQLPEVMVCSREL